jgi:hypothetical protein
MKPTVTLTIHENYVNVRVRFYGKHPRSYVEYSLVGASAVKLLTEHVSALHLRSMVETFGEEKLDVTEAYLDGFRGHFTFTYEVNLEDIQEFKVVDSRFISPSHGGRSVNGAFRDVNWGKKIFTNLLQATSLREVNRLNNIMQGLYNVGG